MTTIHDPVAAGMRAFTEELARAGLHEAIVCPGSRSTPVALALAAHGGLRVEVLLDERSAGFVALGMARAARRPVAVLVTSGTAAAELLPAVAEADLARAPLLLLTADRPPELRDRGAPQTIDQVGLFGSHVRWAAELPLLDGAAETVAETLAHVRWLAGRAVAEARGTGRGPGPVHLDLPFREPLVPAGRLGPEPDLPGAPFVRALGGRQGLSRADLDVLAARLAAVERGLIVAGPDDDPAVPAAIAALAAATGYPVVADGLSGAGSIPGVLRGDHLLRPGPWVEAHPPDLVLRTGAIPTSRPTGDLVAGPGHELWVIDGDAGWRQPAPRPATIIHADPADTLHELAARLPGVRTTPWGTPWGTAWADAGVRVRDALRAWADGLDEPFEGAPFLALAEALGDGAILWAGSSMPVRDLDAWWVGARAGVRALASRGANGIDGVTSAAAGAAAASGAPVVLVTGDVSFVHDLGGLVSARLMGVALTVVVIDNDGGGIFSFLPQAAVDRPEVGLPEQFERLFGTPHGTRVLDAARALGAAAVDVDHLTLRRALSAAIEDRTPGIRLLRFASRRDRNAALHAEAAQVAAAALARLA